VAIRIHEREKNMKDGWDYSDYINYINHFFLQELVDFDYLVNNKSSADALTVIGDDNA
jgi:hypothetical protein